MAKRRKKIVWFPKWSRWTVVGVIVLIIGWNVFDALFGETLAVRAAIRGLATDDDEAIRAIRDLGKPALPRLESELLAGGRDFELQQTLTRILLVEPFYARRAIDEALASDDPVVRRAAVSAMLLEYAEQGKTSPKLEDLVLTALAEWVTVPDHPWLPQSLGFLYLYKDPRVVDFLLPLLDVPPPADPEARARVQETRWRAVRRLSPFAKDARVGAALQRVIAAKEESPRVRQEAVRSLAAGGASDPDAYWTAANSAVAFERQAVAENLGMLKDPRVNSVLIHLAGDENIDVRRAALLALVRKRAPYVMQELDYLVEDRYHGIRADMVMAVGQYRERTRIPFLVAMIADFDPEVVRIAYLELTRLTRLHHGFSEAAWTAMNRLPVPEQAVKMKSFMNDRKRRDAAIAAWAAVYPPAPDPMNRVPYLIRMLAHRDSGNVERAMRELIKLTERREGFPPELLGGDVPIEKSAVARLAFMASDRQKLADEWMEWWKNR